jgi:outer membrane murein-binding lipoprotein Lpp
MPLILPMTRLAALLVAGVSLFAASSENSKAAQVRRIINDLKATVAQLQNQINALESQLGDAAQAAAAATPSARPRVSEKLRGRCAATTERGTRCSRPAVAGKRTCWQH